MTEDDMEQPRDAITFLGTAGARIMVAKQLLASGGIWLNLGGAEILLDPGPGCLVQAIKRKLNPARLAAIILSHRHLDHSGDVNVMIEAMTEGGLRRRGVVFAPGDALEGDPVILKYLRGFPDRIEALTQGGSYQVGDVIFHTPLSHRHGVETYGLVFETPRNKFSFIVDSAYFEGLAAPYRSDVIVMNVVRLDPGGPFYHLSVDDARKIIIELKPKAAILTHFGMTMWRARPWEVANNLSVEMGVRVIAARDGMRVDLDELNRG